jgi:D-alanyl-lipoteichoic acid acyltransferase DltB (MBOAT superfamily)
MAFAMQIYCDFSGYTDLARGSANLLGYEIPENFQGPFLSQSYREIWSRWHITLSSWLRDYLYIPLGGSKGTVFSIECEYVYYNVPRWTLAWRQLGFRRLGCLSWCVFVD